MIQEASDADIILHAEQTVERHRDQATDGSPEADLIVELEMVLGALRRHQPVSPAKGWNEAWDRFDGNTTAP